MVFARDMSSQHVDQFTIIGNPFMHDKVMNSKMQKYVSHTHSGYHFIMFWHYYDRGGIMIRVNTGQTFS